MSRIKKVLIGASISIAVIAVIALLVALRPKTLDEELRDFKLNVPKSSVNAVAAGIENGKRIAQDSYTQQQDKRQQIESETQTMKDMLEDAISK